MKLVPVKVGLNDFQRLMIDRADFDNEIIFIKLTPFQMIGGDHTLFVCCLTKELMKYKIMNNEEFYIKLFPSSCVEEENHHHRQMDFM